MTPATMWFVTPVYLDAEAFRILRERILEVVGADPRLSGAAARFVAVDDSGGVDPETTELEESPDVTLVIPPFNLGHQRAIVYALRSLEDVIADEDIVVTLDADGEDKPEDLPRLLAPLLESPGNKRLVALALRTRRRESPLFKLLYFFFRVTFNLLTGEVIRSGNYAAYRGWLATRILRHPYFDLSYASTLVSLELPLVKVPCERGRRYAGRSRMSYPKLARHGLGMLMPFTDRIAVRALLLFVSTLVLSLILALVVIGVRLFSDAGIPGWATSTLLLLVVLSFVAFGNAVVMFALFSQSRGAALSTLEEVNRGRARGASRPPD